MLLITVNVQLIMSSLLPVRTYHTRARKPPAIANIMARLNAPGTKDARISKTIKIVNAIIPVNAFTLSKILPRNITTEIIMPAMSPRKNPRKVPGV